MAADEENCMWKIRRRRRGQQDTSRGLDEDGDGSTEQNRAQDAEEWSVTSKVPPNGSEFKEQLTFYSI